MATEGSTQVSVVGLEDKREVLCCSLSGDLHPPQLIYTGKTPQCHTTVLFPDGWHVWHSANHWNNEQTMLKYVEHILTPYFTNILAQSGLPQDQIALLINPRRACAARVTVVVPVCLCVCVCVCYSQSHLSNVRSSHKRYDLLNGQRRSEISNSFL